MVHKHLHKYPVTTNFHDVEWDSDQMSYALFRGRDHIIKIAIWCEGGHDDANKDLCSHRVIWLDKNNPAKPLPFMIGIQVPGYPGGKECTRYEIAEILQQEDIIPPAHFLHDRPCKYAAGPVKKGCTIQ